MLLGLFGLHRRRSFRKQKLRITGFYIAGNAVGGMVGRVISSQVSHYKSWQFVFRIYWNLVSYFCDFIFYTAPKSQNFKPKKESFKTLIELNFKLIITKIIFLYYRISFVGNFCKFVQLHGFFFLVKAPFNISRSWISYVYVLLYF